jgi:putative oxygen-independent coproporphyrinogen III oxidase
MPSALPNGEPVPEDGALPASALERVGANGFGVYLHVPFCASRCGYCDFNTYTAAELGGGGAQREYARTVLAEIELARRVLGGAAPRVDTVFIGGGTPTLLGPDDLGRLLDGVDRAFGLAAGAEVTTEANPESVDPASLKKLRRAGFTRISLGMQSVAPHVLALLDRRHTPGRAAAAATEAREAGFEHVNLDLIYGTPGERPEDFAASLDAAIGAGVDHVSAYSLIVEDGTRLAARVSRGEVPDVDDDVAADRYLAAESRLDAAGFAWYEVSNWARSAGPERSGREAGAACRHNLVYWRGGDWWGFGPGAHSHIGGVRWWNVKHPSTYASRLHDKNSPGYARERLTPAERHTEAVLLGVRLAEGLHRDLAEPAAVRRLVHDGLLVEDGDRVVLTLRGRLLADAVVRALLP